MRRVRPAGHLSAKGQPSIIAGVDNTGGRAVDLNGTASLTGGPGDTSAGPFPAKQIITLAPGQSGTMSFTPPKTLPHGPWQAKVTMVSGFTTSTRTQTIQFSSLVASQAALLVMAGAGIAVVLVLVIAFFVVRYARRNPPVPA